MNLSETAYEDACAALLASRGKRAFGEQAFGKQAFGEGLGQGVGDALSGLGEHLRGVDWRGLLSHPGVAGALLGAGTGGVLGGLSGMTSHDGSLLGGALTGALAGGALGGGLGTAYPHLRRWLSPEEPDPRHEAAVQAMSAGPADVGRPIAATALGQFPLTSAYGAYDAGRSGYDALANRRIRPGESRLRPLLQRGIEADPKGPVAQRINDVPLPGEYGRGAGRVYDGSGASSPLKDPDTFDRLQHVIDRINPPDTRSLKDRLLNRLSFGFAGAAPPTPMADGEPVIPGRPATEPRFPPFPAGSTEYEHWVANGAVGAQPSYKVEGSPEVHPVDAGQFRERMRAGLGVPDAPPAGGAGGAGGKAAPGSGQQVRRNVFTGAESVHQPRTLLQSVRGRMLPYGAALGADLLSHLGRSYRDDWSRQDALERYAPR